MTNNKNQPTSNHGFRVLVFGDLALISLSTVFTAAEASVFARSDIFRQVKLGLYFNIAQTRPVAKGTARAPITGRLRR
jgi:hypothetical protein